MRSVFILLFCVILVIAIVFVVVHAPTPSNVQIAVVPIDLERQPQPVMQSDPAANHILEFFPEAIESLPLQTPEDITHVPEPAPTQAQKPETGDPIEIQKYALLAHINDWVYEMYSQVGSTKLGQIKDTRQNTLMKVYEGKTLENGVEVVRLSAESVLLKLGEATFTLRLAEEPKFFEDIKKNPRALTPEEQSKAYDYYMIRWGDKFKEYSKGYQPPAGMQNPQPATLQMKQQGYKEYMERYGQKFQENGNTYQMPEINPEKQRELYKKYWEKFHPDREMPDFDQLFQTTIHSGPGARLQN
ncbi:MAG: DUF2531 family protein [Candidatus Omnitrophota bacterium]|jgi:hypothetical protein|nr:MAG: DUF2531 family protein [Candidatus Omnitrophota bacterium]